ncbi:MAG: formylglycine-generating enzyme family protein [Leptolyngbyaceae bacterium]|nr:formylglycine-generating enzyme family protein [Leptolyngbyaceae bacterium]
MPTSPSIQTESGVHIRREQSSVLSVSQPLSEAVSLVLVKVPSGEFLMGSPEDELERTESEGPQHRVKVSGFWMGQYPVTQAEWRIVAGYPQVNRELNSDPSQFKGNQLPVEQVSWEDAVEFCQRLSQHTGFNYRLPTEAEWEYACRAGTTTPFHFGETITTDLANYRGTDWKEQGWSGSYGDGPKGIYREETTSVGSFGVSNAFGLCDMHGNVFEWCQDPWHENYKGTPTDGSAWQENTLQSNHRRVTRGGSWRSNPGKCRSAYRDLGDPVYRSSSIGFRVVLAPH